MMSDLVHWEECAIGLERVVVKIGNKNVLRRLTKEGTGTTTRSSTSTLR